MWGACTGAAMRSKGEAPSQVHKVRFTAIPEQELPEEGARVHLGEEGSNAGGTTKKEATDDKGSSPSYTYTYDTEDEEPEGDEGKDDPGEEGIPLQSDTLEEYYTKRVFIFIHHYAGPEDPLTTAMRNEALAQGIRLKAFSVEKSNGTGDLLDDEPYSKHLRWARRGYVDAYHAGFPCATFSRLRWRRAPNQPGPVRSKSEPCGMKANTQSEQAECDRGTIMACRAIDMAVAVCSKKQIAKVPPVATLENPLPSDTEGHLSAWELGEVEKFRETTPHNVVQFNTCGHENGLPVGKKHFKPQMFAGSLRGLKTLKRECQCGYTRATTTSSWGPRNRRHQLHTRRSYARSMQSWPLLS